MLKAFDQIFHGKVEIEDFSLIKQYMQTALKSLLGKQQIMINLHIDLINKLGKEKTPRGIQKLLALLEVYDLPQLTSVTSIITDRLSRLRVFAHQITNEKAYEIKGKNSIHNQLANALWILDDSYWLLHSNEPLKHFLVKEAHSSKKDAKLRPDLICVSNKHNLTVVELKRPSHQVTMNDLNQLQNYLAIVDRFRPEFVTKMGYIIAKEISDHLQKIVNNIKNVEFKSYVQLTNDCQRRYQEYIDALEEKE